LSIDAVDRLEYFLRSDLGASGPVPLHEPCFMGNEKVYLGECIETGWVSTAGEFVNRFETELAARCGARHAIATVNGTAALHAALLALGIGPGDAVVCPTLTFVATANAIAYCGATPLFADSEKDALSLCPDQIGEFLKTDCKVSDGRLIHKDTDLRIAAIMPVHLFGHPANMTGLNVLADAYDIPVLEDATESLGSTYHDRPTGSLGRAGVLSFNGNKIITSGGGGAVVTDDDTLASDIRHLTTTARRARGWQHDHDKIGFNYRMPNLNAALGLAQLEQMDRFTQIKRDLATMYQKLFAGQSGVKAVREQGWAKSNYWLNAILLDSREARDEFLGEANRREIQVRPCWRLMSDLSMYSDSPVAGDLANARDIEDRLVNLPSSATLMATRACPA
jgi:perosamine synthetase